MGKGGCKARIMVSSGVIASTQSEGEREGVARLGRWELGV